MSYYGGYSYAYGGMTSAAYFQNGPYAGQPIPEAGTPERQQMLDNLNSGLQNDQLGSSLLDGAQGLFSGVQSMGNSVGGGISSAASATQTAFYIIAGLAGLFLISKIADK
jgi:hypothetical protein